jgi:hypothetical protein
LITMTATELIYTLVAVGPSVKHPDRLPRVVHLSANVAPRAAGRPGQMGTGLCGNTHLFDEEGFNDLRVGDDTEGPVLFRSRKICGMCVELRRTAEMPKCQKVSYSDKVSALLAVEGLRDRRTAEKAECNVYYCNRHQAWHLTSKRGKRYEGRKPR